MFTNKSYLTSSIVPKTLYSFEIYFYLIVTRIQESIFKMESLSEILASEEGWSFMLSFREMKFTLKTAILLKTQDELELA